MLDKRLSLEQEQKRRYFIAITIIMLLLCLCIGLIAGLIIRTNKQYEYAIENPPTLFEVEERCEQEFWTTDLIVYEMVEEGEGIAIYIIKANGLYYKVKFGVKQLMGSVWWDYLDYKQIAESVMEEY